MRNKKGQFKKGQRPWNKDIKGIHLSPRTEFKKGDNVIPLDIRFWEKVNKTDSCWLWTGSKNNTGYGRVGVRGKLLLAHRVSFEMVNGKIKKGMNVLHKCDIPSCVNPNHLWLGSHKENMKDMYKKGRACTGEDRPQSKLTIKKVEYIRERYKIGDISQRELAKEIGISQPILCQVINKKRW